jgi:hypothetical protein
MYCTSMFYFSFTLLLELRKFTFFYLGVRMMYSLLEGIYYVLLHVHSSYEDVSRYVPMYISYILYSRSEFLCT